VHGTGHSFAPVRIVRCVFVFRCRHIKGGIKGGALDRPRLEDAIAAIVLRFPVGIRQNSGDKFSSSDEECSVAERVRRRSAYLKSADSTAPMLASGMQRYGRHRGPRLLPDGSGMQRNLATGGEDWHQK
jgi:hypothetical protein